MTAKVQKEFYKELYTSMVRIRYCEESFVEPIISKEILCPVHLSCGHEAVAVGVCAALSKEDFVFGTHRSHGHYLAKGASMKEMVAEIYCKEAGCAKGRGGSMHVTSPEDGVLGVVPIVGGTIPLATGAALASVVKGENRVAVSFFGDGAVGEGTLAESLNFAALMKLPIIFVCENNLYSTHLPISECRPINNIVEMPKPYGIESVRVDGNDVLAVYKVATHAIEKCRKGKGPFFIECMTYRLRGHVGPDDNIQGSHTDIRPESEIKRWRKRDPVVKFRSYLEKKVRVNKHELDAIEFQATKEVEDAHEYARQSPWPVQSELMNYVFKQ